MKSLVYPFLSHSSHYLMFNNTFRFFLFDSLRKLVRILQRFRCFQRACVLGEAPHFSTFSRAAKWFREQGFPVFHAQLLQDLEVRYPQIVLIDSTALRSSLYDSQAKWGVSSRYHWFKGYKLHPLHHF
jgi:hypothetical protein